jgi:hypothetical protein
MMNGAENRLEFRRPDMEGVISYRPSIGKKKLTEAVEKLHFDNTNQFIDFAVMSALVSRENPKVKKLLGELAGVIYRSAPLRFTKPTPREDKEIRRRLAEMKKGRSVVMKRGDAVYAPAEGKTVPACERKAVYRAKR